MRTPSTRLFRSVAAIAMVLFLSTAAAAQCVIFEDPKELFDRSDAVFAGTVLSQRNTGNEGSHTIQAVATIRVDRTWKGRLTTDVSVGADRRFEVGQRYVIFASGDQLSTSLLCLWAERAEQARVKLAWLSSLLPAGVVDAPRNVATGVVDGRRQRMATRVAIILLSKERLKR